MKNLIKVPKDVIVIYSIKENILILIGPLKTKKLKLKVKLKFITEQKLIQIVNNCNYKKHQIIKKTTISLIKQAFIEISNILYIKLKFIGVGYRILTSNELKKNVLIFKLGYSHSLYYKISDQLQTFCLRSTKLFIFGNSYQEITQTAANIRLYKKPEPYKGKGILYDTENIKLKEGKKI